MVLYIDKDALVAEIERRKQDAINNCGGFKSMREHECDSCIVGQYEEMEEIIDTLEVKEVDLEKELSYEDYIGFFKEHPNFPDDWGFDEAWVFAKYFFELGLKAQKGE